MLTAAVVFLVVVLLGARGAGTPSTTAALPPIVATEPPLSAETGYPAGSPEDLASQSLITWTAAEDHRRTEELAFASAISTGAGIGASIGSIIPGLGTAAGAAIGAIIGWIVGVVNDIASGNPPPAPAFPIADVGMPFRPELATWNGDALSMKLPALLPAQLEANRGSPAGTIDVAFPRDLLEELFPGDGALEACRRSGMLCWRPGDQPTPFAALLYTTMPALWGYEASLIGTEPGDITAGGLTLRWFGTDWGSLTEPQRQTLLILNARRLAVWRERRAPVTRIIQGQPYTYLRGHPDQPPPGKVLHEGTDFGLWLMWTYGKTARHNRDLSQLVYLARSVDLYLPVQNPRSASLRLTDLRTVGKGTDADMGLPPMPKWAAAEVQPRKRTPSHMGFPGARRAVPRATPLGPFPALPLGRGSVRRALGIVSPTPAPMSSPIFALDPRPHRLNDGRAPSPEAVAFRLVADNMRRLRAEAATKAAAAAGAARAAADVKASLADVAAKLQPGSAHAREARAIANAAKAAAQAARLEADAAAKAAADFNEEAADRFVAAATAAEREPGAFRFEVWLPGYSCVVTSSFFVPAYGSHAAVSEALRSNRLAWNIAGRTDRKARSVWFGLDARLPEAEAFLVAVGWEPFA